MKGVSRDWPNLPRYQRAIQRIAKMSPQQRTILDSLDLADSDQKKRLVLMEMLADGELEPRDLFFYLRSLTSEYPQGSRG